MNSPASAGNRFGLLALTVFGGATLALAQSPAPPSADSLDAAKQIIAMERDHSDVMDNLEYLSDQIGPRLTGSARLYQANQWTMAKMKAYGLENVHLEPYTIPCGWERRKVEAKIIAPNTFDVIAAQYAWTPGTHGKITGNVIIFAPTTEADFAAYKGKLKGAIVLTSPLPTPEKPGPAPALPDGKALPVIPAFPPAAPASADPVPAPRVSGREDEDANQPPPPDRAKAIAFRAKVREFMKQEGVAVTLIDAGKPHALLNMTGSWTNIPPYTPLFVAHEQIALIQRYLSHNLPVKMEIQAGGRIINKPITVYNTVGEIRGSEKPNEIVLIGGHLDSWDLGQGSTDNGTGAMAVLEAARDLATLNVHPKRTIRFVLFSGEEEGLHGSEAYVKAHKAEMPNVDVVFIHDTGTGRVKGAWLQNRVEDKPMLTAQFALLQAAGLMTDAPNLLPGKMNGTDHASFDDAGVPAFAFNQESIEYGLTHHSQSDTFDKARPDDLKQGACVLALFALTAAQSTETYPRAPAKP